MCQFSANDIFENIGNFKIVKQDKFIFLKSIKMEKLEILLRQIFISNLSIFEMNQTICASEFSGFIKVSKSINSVQSKCICYCKKPNWFQLNEFIAEDQSVAELDEKMLASKNDKTISLEKVAEFLKPIFIKMQELKNKIEYFENVCCVKNRDKKHDRRLKTQQIERMEFEQKIKKEVQVMFEIKTKEIEKEFQMNMSENTKQLIELKQKVDKITMNNNFENKEQTTQLKDTIQMRFSEEANKRNTAVKKLKTDLTLLLDSKINEIEKDNKLKLNKCKRKCANLSERIYSTEKTISSISMKFDDEVSKNLVGKNQVEKNLKI